MRHIFNQIHDQVIQVEKKLHRWINTDVEKLFLHKADWKVVLELSQTIINLFLLSSISILNHFVWQPLHVTSQSLFNACHLQILQV